MKLKLSNAPLNIIADGGELLYRFLFLSGLTNSSLQSWYLYHVNICYCTVNKVVTAILTLRAICNLEVQKFTIHIWLTKWRSMLDFTSGLTINWRHQRHMTFSGPINSLVALEISHLFSIFNISWPCSNKLSFENGLENGCPSNPFKAWLYTGQKRLDSSCQFLWWPQGLWFFLQ